eukprot:1139060-Pelagomonas_calceolata.AAC.3
MPCASAKVTHHQASVQPLCQPGMQVSPSPSHRPSRCSLYYSAADRAARAVQSSVHLAQLLHRTTWTAAPAFFVLPCAAAGWARHACVVQLKPVGTLLGVLGCGRGLRLGRWARAAWPVESLLANDSKDNDTACCIRAFVLEHQLRSQAAFRSMHL